MLCGCDVRSVVQTRAESQATFGLVTHIDRKLCEDSNIMPLTALCTKPITRMFVAFLFVSIDSTSRVVYAPIILQTDDRESDPIWLKLNENELDLCSGCNVGTFFLRLLLFNIMLRETLEEI